MDYRELAEHSPTSILVVRNGIILYTNPAFSFFSGYNETEITGKDLISFVNPSDHEEFTMFTKNWTNVTPIAERGEFRFVTKSGKCTGGFTLNNTDYAS